MAGPYVADRVRETTNTAGTGTVNLEGAEQGFRTFLAGVGDGNTCFYMITDGTDWETGKGTVTSGAPDTLSRDVVYASSNGGLLVNFLTGPKEVIVAMPAQREDHRYVKVGLSGAVAVPNGGYFIPDWTTVTENFYGLYDGVSPKRLTIDLSGLYEVFLGGPWAADPAGRREVEFRKNGTTSFGGVAVPAAPTLETRHAIVVPARFVAGDYVETRFRHSLGVNLNFGSADLNTYFGLRRVAP